jgi:hypothetical protein
MVNVREPRQPSQPKMAALSEAEKAAKSESFGNEAIPKKKRVKTHYKAINIPFNTEADYLRLVAAAQKANRKPTDFIKAAIKVAIDRQEAIERQKSQH